MKKTNKPSNPLKFFNDNKAMAYKKAGGAMKDFKKSLPKAQTGMNVGPMEEEYQNYMDTAKKNAVASQQRNIIYGPQGTFNNAYNTDMADIRSKENAARGTLNKYRKTGGSVKSRKK